ncbi:MAG: head-tail connector protein [Selenomonadaceae bacterium]|nr:head-tail connector protein [Selenomonadaceae bacterium]MBR1730690.1 head-tail connector protein [Selenomonadaceae bacterium]
MAVTLERFKLYLRIDSDFEDELINQFLLTAKAYLRDAITDYEENYQKSLVFAEKADLLQMIVAAEFYQNRDNSNHSLNYTIRSMMTQLKYWGDDEISSEIVIESVIQ